LKHCRRRRGWQRPELRCACRILGSAERV